MTAVRESPRLVRDQFIAELVILISTVITANAPRWLFTCIDGFAQPLSHVLLRLENPLPGA